ncbi:ABC transporter ATP-binding protein [Salinibacterium sp. NG22]|uniref:ABC transporter ATP-binding protein n=1 Tax=unclassified Salinibacterium TaxID=2632331 RepID=UPI0018CDE5A8|nr:MULTISPECIES: ABC transporter ATP-binding protein [unclassified Salinibacterium]MBH0023494.1 ABC transporter ATP-binding protein [Salinibacterium sp. SWN248]MBH0109496.1 ABC transporter ATP-binding protein [Salinibacterium sp. NG22]
MSQIELRNIGKSYGDKEIIPSLDLTIEAGSFSVLVGPSGCGKSTTLRMIAGLEKPTTGTISIGGKTVDNVTPGQRGVAMVFQNYAIYPTMTVEENIEFGLRNNKVPKLERRELVHEIAETVGLTPHLRKNPDALSGGERQRVALARAMVKKPAVFLMDEPLSNLDAKLRQHMRIELIELHERLGATFVYVTHDQVEAMSMGTSIVLMDAGRIQQQSAPTELYAKPQNVFTSRFIGTPPMNVVPIAAFGADVAADAPEGAEWLGVRPERLTFADTSRPVVPGETELTVTIIALENLGAELVYRAVLPDGSRIAIKRFDEIARPLGDALVRVETNDIHWFDANEERIAEPAISGQVREVVSA